MTKSCAECAEGRPKSERLRHRKQPRQAASPQAGEATSNAGANFLLGGGPAVVMKSKSRAGPSASGRARKMCSRRPASPPLGSPCRSARRIGMSGLPGCMCATCGVPRYAVRTARPLVRVWRTCSMSSPGESCPARPVRTATQEAGPHSPYVQHGRTGTWVSAQFATQCCQRGLLLRSCDHVG